MSEEYEAIKDAKNATAVAENNVYRIRSTKKVETGKKFNEETKTTEVQYSFISVRPTETIQQLVNLKPKSFAALKSRDIGHALNCLEILNRFGFNCNANIEWVVNNKKDAENKEISNYYLSVINCNWDSLQLPKDFFVPQKYRMK